jgi:hypothetical protein
MREHKIYSTKNPSLVARGGTAVNVKESIKYHELVDACICVPTNLLTLSAV